MDKPNIAIICGGYSGEAEVSQRSAQTILKQINQDLFTPYLVTIARDAWSVTDACGLSLIHIFFLEKTTNPFLIYPKMG